MYEDLDLDWQRKRRAASGYCECDLLLFKVIYFIMGMGPFQQYGNLVVLDDERNN